MRLRYTAQAVSELDEILAYIAARSPAGASRVHARIKAVIDLLERHPQAGQRTSMPRVRRILATPYRYLIFYEQLADEVVVIGVRHSARSPASMPGKERP